MSLFVPHLHGLPYNDHQSSCVHYLCVSIHPHNIMSTYIKQRIAGPAALLWLPGYDEWPPAGWTDMCLRGRECVCEGGLCACFALLSHATTGSRHVCVES